MKIETLHDITSSIPKEVPAVFSGAAIASVSLTALDYIEASTMYHTWSSSVVTNFLSSVCTVTAIAGTIIAISSAILLAKKLISNDKSLKDNLITLGTSLLVAAIANTLAESIWDIAPRFWWLGEHSLSFCVGTHLAGYVCVITGIAGIAFTAYATYHITNQILNSISPQPQLPLIDL